MYRSHPISWPSVLTAERQPAIRDRPSVAEPYVVGSRIPGPGRRFAVSRWNPQEPARRLPRPHYFPGQGRSTTLRLRPALRRSDYDLSIVLSPVDGGKRAGWGSRLSGALVDRQQALGLAILGRDFEDG